MDTGRRIIYAGGLIHKFFGVGPENALTAIILVMEAIRYKYANIEVQISERLNKLITKEGWKQTETPLCKQLPVVINDRRSFNIKLELDNTGRLAKHIITTLVDATDTQLTPPQHRAPIQ